MAALAKPWVVVWLIGACLWGAGAARADDPRPAAAEAASLAALLDEYDRLEQELIQTRIQWAAAAERTARRRLKVRIHALETRQAEIAAAVERLVGPLPPTVPPERPSLQEQQQSSQEQRQDTLMDRRVAP